MSRDIPSSLHKCAIKQMCNIRVIAVGKVDVDSDFVCKLCLWISYRTIKLWSSLPGWRQSAMPWGWSTSGKLFPWGPDYNLVECVTKFMMTCFNAIILWPLRDCACMWCLCDIDWFGVDKCLYARCQVDVIYHGAAMNMLRASAMVCGAYMLRLACAVRCVVKCLQASSLLLFQGLP